MLFAGLVVVLLLQPALPGQDLTADDLVVVVAMWLVALVPGVLFARGVASRTPRTDAVLSGLRVKEEVGR